MELDTSKVQGFLYETKDYLFKYPTTHEENMILQEFIIDSFNDNARYQLLDLDRETTAIYIEWSRDWDWKNYNRVAAYHKASGKLAAAYRMKRGDQSELKPYPKEL